jgi:hypothetical protein
MAMLSTAMLFVMAVLTSSANGNCNCCSGDTSLLEVTVKQQALLTSQMQAKLADLDAKVNALSGMSAN